MSIRLLLWGWVALLFFVGAYLTFSGQSSASIAVPSQPTVAGVTIVPASLTKDGVPTKLGALSLTQMVTGLGALAEFTQLHGQGLELVGGYRADYGDASGKATLWVAQAKDSASAQSQLDAMAQKIERSNATFQNLQPLDISGRTLYQADGQGQKHFFYAVNDKVVWLAADANQAAEVLHSLWSAVK